MQRGNIQLKQGAFDLAERDYKEVVSTLTCRDTVLTFMRIKRTATYIVEHVLMYS